MIEDEMNKKGYTEIAKSFKEYRERRAQSREMFFDDLCTVTELQAMEQRFHVAECLSKGMIYNDILTETGASSATISRVNRSLQYGKGGYDVVFPRLNGEEEADK